MNRMTDIPQYPGDELEKIMDYRYRAFLLGGIQMVRSFIINKQVN